MDQAQYNAKLKRQADKRRARARRLKESGKTWKQVGEIMKITRQRAWKLGKVEQ